MNSEIRKLLESVQAGETSVDDAMLELKKAPFEDIGYAKVDLHRKVRQGAAEVIYGAGKTPEQARELMEQFYYVEDPGADRRHHRRHARQRSEPRPHHQNVPRSGGLCRQHTGTGLP